MTDRVLNKYFSSHHFFLPSVQSLQKEKPDFYIVNIPHEAAEGNTGVHGSYEGDYVRYPRHVDSHDRLCVKEVRRGRKTCRIPALQTLKRCCVELSSFLVLLQTVYPAGRQGATGGALRE